MAVSAFKSSSKRSNPTTSSSSSSSPYSTAKTDLDKKPPIRRSRSVSAFSRTSLDSDNFSNKRDNPLFCSTTTPIDPKKPAKDSTSADDTTRRGRSTSRNADVVVGRSLSRVDPGRTSARIDTGLRRNRSVSRGRNVISKSEDEQECCSSLNKTAKVGGSEYELKGLRTWSSQHSHDAANLSNFENGVSTASSLSGAEDKTACQQMNMSSRLSADNLSAKGMHVEDDTTSTSNIYETVRSEVRRAISDIQEDLESAMRRSNNPTIATTDISDIHPDLVSPSAVELVLDIRREYAKKLEQSKERARKLQSDLAVEEHRGQELSRILKEVLPDPKISNPPKSRPVRKASIERRKMSKRLTDEALTYFDECVSLSTFDSSDFSSPEDPLLNIVGFTTPVDKNQSLLQASSSASVTSSLNCIPRDKQVLSIRSHFTNVMNPSGVMTGRSPGEPTLNEISPNSAKRAQDSKFSFAHKPTETAELQQDIKKYVRHTKKDDMEFQSARSIYCDLGKYNLQAQAQSYTFERVLFGNRIESRGILLCGGGISSSFSPFASFL